MINNHKYDDIINLEHHVSKKHKQMSLENRSAQFAPFAALTGFEELVKETARQTDVRIEIDEELKNILDEKIGIIQKQIRDNPEITVTYFVPDCQKDGGKYQTKTEKVKKIDQYNKIIILIDGTVIPIREIVDIGGDIFADFFDFGESI